MTNWDPLLGPNIQVVKPVSIWLKLIFKITSIKKTIFVLPKSFDTLVAFLSDISGAINGLTKSVRATAANELRPDEIVLKKKILTKR